MAIDTRTSNMLIGGLRPIDPFLETYWVRPGGATVVILAPDDRVTVIDVDGGQAAEVTVLDPDGAEVPEAIGMIADAPATVLRALVASLADGASDVVADLSESRASIRPRRWRRDCSTGGDRRCLRHHGRRIAIWC